MSGQLNLVDKNKNSEILLLLIIGNVLYNVFKHLPRLSIIYGMQDNPVPLGHLRPDKSFKLKIISNLNHALHADLAVV